MPVKRLTELPSFAARDRVLVIAPHPDDEAIATGGALQAAHAAGADCRVLVITDGDNNPWPQRWIEKRWRIGAADRARWGAERRAEAMAALQVLGLASTDVRFFGFPDLGLTDLLMRGDAGFDTALAAQLAEFPPTRVFLPALDDRHPDHSALHVLMQLKLLARPAEPPKLYTFGVHGDARDDGSMYLELSAAQRETKRVAIMSHQTQMHLSRRRFVGYARAREPFGAASVPGSPDPRHAVQATINGDGELAIRIDHPHWRGLNGQVLFAAFHRADGDPLRRIIQLSGTNRGEIVDTQMGRSVGQAAIGSAAGKTDVRLTIGSGVAAGWIKLARPEPGLFVLDRSGWQTIGVDEAERVRGIG